MFGVAPLVGPTSSHPLPLFVVEVTVKLIAVFGSVLVSEIVWLATVVPVWVVTLTAEGLTFSSGELLTWTVTGMIKGLLPAPGEVMVTDPLQVPAVRPDTLTATATVPGVELAFEVADRKFIPQFVDAAVAV